MKPSLKDLYWMTIFVDFMIVHPLLQLLKLWTAADFDGVYPLFFAFYLYVMQDVPGTT
jgi:hypothetical protein